MADLSIDYSLLQTLSQDITTLKGDLDADVKLARGAEVPTLTGTTTGSVTTDAGSLGDAKLAQSVVDFYKVCYYPFNDAMSRLQQLADLFGKVGAAFGEFDAGVAGKAESGVLGLRYAAWKDRYDAYQYYLAHKDSWDPHRPIPTDPGAAPTTASDGGTTVSVTRDANGNVLTETTTTTMPNGSTYTEQTTYTYGADGRPTDYSTTITHGDGSTEKIVWHATSATDYTVTQTSGEGTTTTTYAAKPNGGGGTTVTVDPKTGTTTTDVVNNPAGTPDTRTVTNPDGSVEHYTGDADNDHWTLDHTDPAPVVIDPGF